MSFGSEQGIAQESYFHKLLWALRGDFHIGRWIRYFQLKKVLDRFPIRPQTILDAGCGTGQNTFYLESRFHSASIDGIDISPDYIRICEAIRTKLRSRISFSVSDLQKFSSPKRYDMILLCNVLYAIADYQRTLFNGLESLSESGWIIIEEMNISFIQRRIGPHVKTVHDAVRMGFTLEELTSLLRDKNIKIHLAQKTIGPSSDFAHRLFGHVRTNSMLLNVLFPFLLFLAYRDPVFGAKDGAGLLIVGQK